MVIVITFQDVDHYQNRRMSWQQAAITWWTEVAVGIDEEESRMKVAGQADNNKKNKKNGEFYV